MSDTVRGENPRRRDGGILGHGKTSKYTGVRLPTKLRQDLEAVAERHHITLSRLIVEVLYDYVGKL
tara:strand:- start:859 stop:1056 length:198 start_codon:yes stop_codon:yes gene_type:complete